MSRTARHSRLNPDLLDSLEARPPQSFIDDSAHAITVRRAVSWIVVLVAFIAIYLVNHSLDLSHQVVAPKWRSGYYGGRFYEDYCAKMMPVHDLHLNTLQKIDLCRASYDASMGDWVEVLMWIVAAVALIGVPLLGALLGAVRSTTPTIHVTVNNNDNRPYVPTLSMLPTSHGALPPTVTVQELEASPPKSGPKMIESQTPRGRRGHASMTTKVDTHT